MLALCVYVYKSISAIKLYFCLLKPGKFIDAHKSNKSIIIKKKNFGMTSLAFLTIEDMLILLRKIMKVKQRLYKIHYRSAKNKYRKVETLKIC